MIVGFVLAVVLSMTVYATETENLGMRALPVPGKVVTVDGKIDDWDLSGGIFACGDAEVLHNKLACWFHLMYDEDNLYVLARWIDQTPINNPGSTAGDFGFAGDCLQLRLVFDHGTAQQRGLHVTAWLGNKNNKHVVDLAYGARFGGPKVSDAQTVGAKQAFSKNADGKGYNQEISFPWELLTKDGRALKAGDKFTVSVEPNFSAGVGGRVTIKDIFKPGAAVDRVFTFMAVNSWGTATLERKGNVKPQTVRLSDSREFDVEMENGVPVIKWIDLIQSKKLLGHKVLKFNMPVDGYVSINIRDDQGIVVRQLLNCDFRARGDHEVKWDGLTTPIWKKPGDPVPAGRYTWKGIYHTGIGLKLRGWACNGGNTPWNTGDGTGNWGGDHGVPVSCATDGQKVYLGWTGSEAGKALVAMDLDGNVKWRHKRGGFGGAVMVAVDGGIVYVVDGAKLIYRLDANKGDYSAWEGSESAEMKVSDLWADPEEMPKSINGIEARKGKLYLAFRDHDFIGVVDGKTGAFERKINVKAPSHIEAVKDDLFYVNSGGATILALNPVTGKSDAVIEGLKNATGIAADSQGNIYVATGAPDNQVKVFAENGKPEDAIGRKGGRPTLGPWVADGMRSVNGIVVDANGKLWAMESTGHPKRVAVWDTKTGKLQKEYFGPTHYGASGGTINPKDPDVMIGEGCEWRINAETGGEECVGVFAQEIHGFVRFCYGANGKEYLACLARGPVKFFERMGPAKYALRATITSEKKTVDDKETNVMVFWSDEDGDQKVQANEKVEVPMTMSLGGYVSWSAAINTDLTLYPGITGQGGAQIKVKDFTACGAPRWDIDGMKKLPPLQGALSSLHNGLVVSCESGPSLFKCYDVATSKLIWTYPNTFHGVHGSHRAPPPEVGLIRGAFGFTGAAHLPEPLGDIWVVNSNVGEWHALTGNGFYLTRLFQGDALKVVFPEKAVPGVIIDNTPPGSGGEDFGGSLVQGVDGKVYIQSGKTGLWNIEVTGLESVRGLSGGGINIDDDEIKLANTFREQLLQKNVGIRRTTVKKMTPAFTGDIKADFDVEKLIEFQRSRAASVKVAVAWDDQYLYLGYEVNDASPWVNKAKTPDALYATGDTIDFQIGTNPDADRKRGRAVLGDLRLSIGNFQGKDTAVIFRRFAAKKAPKIYNSGVFRNYKMESVLVVKGAKITVTKRNKAYVVEAAIPLAALGFKPTDGMALRADFGVTHGDAGGQDTVLRTYWNNQKTGIVDDEVAELMMEPSAWGELIFRE